MIPVAWAPERIESTDGMVLIDGSGGLTLFLRPAEAREVAKRILCAARQAQLQHLRESRD